MPVINWVFLCDYAYIDATGKKSIIGMFEYMKVKKLPINWPQLYVAVDLTATQGEEFKMKVLLTAPSGKEIGKIDFQMRGAKANQVNNQKAAKIFLPLSFYNLKITETGEYHIELFVDDIPVHVIPLNVMSAG